MLEWECASAQRELGGQYWLELPVAPPQLCFSYGCFGKLNLTKSLALVYCFLERE